MDSNAAPALCAKTISLHGQALRLDDAPGWGGCKGRVMQFVAFCFLNSCLQQTYAGPQPEPKQQPIAAPHAGSDSHRKCTCGKASLLHANHVHFL